MISAVIPVYDREHLVGRAIESVLAQDTPPAEVIVVDDGSTDGTAEVVRRFGPRVRLIEQANAGASAARNHGVREASGDWIAFLDSDDTWDPGHLGRLARAIVATDGSADLYFANTRRTPEEGAVMLWEACGFAIDEEHQLVADAGAWASLPRQPMMLQSSAFERRSYLECGGLLERLLSREDTHLFFRLCVGRPACAVAGLGACMTSDGGNARLSVGLNAQTMRHWEQTDVMYTDLLSGVVPLTVDQRRELARRLSHGLIQLARFRWREGRRMSALGHLVRAFKTSPRHFLARAARRL